MAGGRCSPPIPLRVHRPTLGSSKYPRDVFLNKMENIFQVGRMRYLRYKGTGGNKKNFITGQTSGARGEFVWTEFELTPGRTDNDVADRGMYVLLDSGKPEFQDKEDIQFSQSPRLRASPITSTNRM